MAESPSHKFGQIIGDILELAVEPILQKFALEYDLYLDKQGPRAVRKGTKVCWRDLNQNTHDLDFVLEKNGSATRVGTPVAFIETAWRRYTKHSRNKVQEIQGAIMPLVETYKNFAPFYGTILAGVFTENALAQLKSLGFSVLFFPYEGVLDAFKLVNIDANYNEDTPDSEFADKVLAWNALSEEQRTRVASALVNSQAKEVITFINALKNAVTRQIELVLVLPLHGTPFHGQSVKDAVEFIEKYDEALRLEVFLRYEIEIRYVNGDHVKANFKDKERAVEFLRTYQLSVKVPDQEQHSPLDQS